MAQSQRKSSSSLYISKAPAGVSVPRERVELFLERWANLDAANAKAYRRKATVFVSAFADLLPSHAAPLFPSKEQSPEDAELRGLIGDKQYFTWAQAQPMLRQIWKEPAPLLKEEGLMMLAGAYMKEHGTGPITWPPDKFLTVLSYALKRVHLLRYCANPECKEPYFVARRGSQIYCSWACAQPAQREARLKWWRERGAARREKARREARKKRGKHAKAAKA